VAGAFLGLALGYSAWPYVSSQFIAGLQAEFGWTRTQIAFAFNINIFTIVLTPGLGAMTDRLGVRPILAACFVLVAAGYLLLAANSGSYPLFVAAMLLLSTAGMGTTGLVFSRAVAGWFETSRGRALAVARLGMSLIGAVLPIAIFSLTSAHGWRAGFVLLALLAAFVGLPVSMAWVRDRRPDHAPAHAPTTGHGELRRLFTDRRLYGLCLAAACTYAPTVGVLSQLQPLLVMKHIPPGVAAQFGGLLGISVVIGTAVTGVLVDRVWAPLVGCAFTLAATVGCLLLLPASLTPVTAGLAVLLVGLAQGAEIDVVAFMIARYFGMRRYSLVFAITTIAIAVLITVTNVAFGWIFDHLGGYGPALLMAAGIAALGSVAYLFLGPYPPSALQEADASPLERSTSNSR
jgi:predicted MFS family arabinose efflux permease